MTTTHRIARALTVLLGAVLIAAGTWAVALRVQSPAQHEAAAAPPPPQPVTVAVTRGDLVEQTTILTTAEYSQTTSLPLPAPADGHGVVTRQGIPAGDTLSSGQVVTWVNSRPVIALPGTFPLYRDLYVGDQGDDVRLLQQALSDLGYGIAIDGALGRATAAAVQELYTAVGAPAPTTPSTPAAPPAPATPQPTAGTTAPAAPQLVMPASEVLVVPTLPAVISSTPDPGTAVDEPAVVVLSTTRAALTAPVPASVEARLTPGLTGSATVEGTSLDVVVSEVRPPTQNTAPPPGSQPDTPASSEATLVLHATSGSLDAWIGRTDVLVTLDLAQPLRNALLVPQRAISLDVNGVATVLVEQKDGFFTQVRVTELGCLAGTCAVSSEDGGLTDGMNVRVDG